MKQYFFITLLVCLPILFSCKDSALEEEYGKTLIYMPQATKNLGTDCNLNILLEPSFNPDTIITLGIYRSGLQQLNSVTVDLVLNTDTVTKAQEIAKKPFADEKYDIYKNGIILPSSYYNPLPAKLMIQDGSREATFGLVIRKGEILNDYNSGDIFLLPVQITNPTLYEINQSLSLTMVVFTVK